MLAEIARMRDWPDDEVVDRADALLEQITREPEA
jgi:hypothetical protein